MNIYKPKLLFVLFLPIFAVILPIAVQAQPPKKSTTIIITGTSFAQVASALTDKNYFIDRKDESLGTIITVGRAIDESPVAILKNNSKRAVHTVFFIRVKDSTATLTGKYNLPGSGYWESLEPISCAGMKGSFNMLAWEAMDNIAKLFGGVLSYSK